MADKGFFDVNEAVKAGASEDQIYDYLRKSTPDFDFDSAAKAGSSKRQIIDYFSKTQAGGASFKSGASDSWGPHGFKESLVEQLKALNPIPAVTTIAKAAGRDPQAARELPDMLYDATIGPSVRMTKKAIKGFATGDPRAPSYLTAIGMGPLGEPMIDAQTQALEGDIPGAIGTTIGAVGPALLGEGAGKVYKKAATGMGKIALRPGIGEATSLADRPRIVDRMLGREIPLDNPNLPPDARTIPATNPTIMRAKALDDISARIAATKAKQSALIDKATFPVPKAWIDRDYILQPVYDLATKIEKVDQSAANNVRAVADELKAKHPPQIDALHAQGIKEALDELFNRADFKDAAEPSGKKGAQRDIRGGVRAAIERVEPQVAPLNQAMHLDYQLREAINTALKKDNSFLRKMSHYELGAGAGLLLYPGTREIGGAVLVGHAVKQALTNPTYASALAVALEKAGVSLPKVTRATLLAGKPADTEKTAAPPETASPSNIGQIPQFGEGGIVTKPTLAVVGESGPEAIVPLKQDYGATGLLPEPIKNWMAGWAQKHPASFIAAWQRHVDDPQGKGLSGLMAEAGKLDPGIGPASMHAAWKEAGIGPEIIAQLSKEPSALHRAINARDLVYHATGPDQLEGILKSGQILPGLASGPLSGVSVSRVPRVASKAERAVSLALDAKNVPPSRPFTEPGYAKTIRNTNSGDLPAKGWETFLSGQELEEYKKLSESSLIAKGKDLDSQWKRMDQLRDAANMRRSQSHNARFEFENRTYGTAIPVSATKEVLVDKSALSAYIHSQKNPGTRWNTVPSPEEIGMAVADIQSKASAHGLNVKVFDTGREMHSYRAGISNAEEIIAQSKRAGLGQIEVAIKNSKGTQINTIKATVGEEGIQQIAQAVAKSKGAHSIDIIPIGNAMGIKKFTRFLSPPETENTGQPPATR